MKNKKVEVKSKKTQPQRFIEKAKELGADESGESMERAFKKIVKATKS